MRWSRIYGLLLAAAAPGCGAAADQELSDPSAHSAWFQELEPVAEFPGTPGPDDRSLFAFDPDHPCATSWPAAARGPATHVRVFRGAGVSRTDLEEFLGGLQRYYSRYGVEFATRYEVISIPLGHALVVDEAALDERVRSETGSDPGAELAGMSAGSEDLVDALGAAILHNLREFVLAYADPRRPDLNLVVLQNMTGGAPPPELAALEDYAGIGFSPELLMRLTQDDGATRRMLDWLELPESFTPTAIVAVEPVRRLLGEPDAALAHEVAHAFGLPHSREAGNLLHTQDLDCASGLSDEQIDQVEAASGAFARTFTAVAPSMVSHADELLDSLRALAQRTR